MRSSVIEVAKLSNIYDFGRIGYRKDGTFAHKSRLDPENQGRITKKFSRLNIETYFWFLIGKIL